MGRGVKGGESGMSLHIFPEPPFVNVNSPFLETSNNSGLMILIGVSHLFSVSFAGHTFPRAPSSPPGRSQVLPPPSSAPEPQG